eukprot:c22002_g2_i1.p1 GENE.c22002_g2_i1~~c22002_g2_i1.p1  ORF type:complete len:806 (-),score=237.11 c22002_g2_i1:35-2452(-)
MDKSLWFLRILALVVVVTYLVTLNLEPKKVYTVVERSEQPSVMKSCHRETDSRVKYDREREYRGREVARHISKDVVTPSPTPYCRADFNAELTMDQYPFICAAGSVVAIAYMGGTNFTLPPIEDINTLLIALIVQGPPIEINFPSELGLAKQLMYIALIQATRDSIPSEIGQLSNLILLLLFTDTNTKAPIPSEIGNLSKLLRLQISNFGIEGSIPSQLGALTKVSTFELNSNLISGSIASELGLMTSLQSLQIKEKVSGSFPSEICSIEQLQSLSVEENEISGTIPSEIAKLQKISEIIFFENRLSGAIPSEIGLMTLVSVIKIGDNSITEQIPSQIGLMTKLTNLSAGKNKLTGTLPSELGMLSNLIYFDISTNTISGIIPSEILNWVNISSFSVEGNSFFGDFSFWKLSNLQSLNLQGNLFTQTIPLELMTLTKLYSLDLSANRYFGTIPSSFYLLSNLVILQLRGNSLTGQLPSQLGLLKSLNLLVVQQNLLTGTIPSEFGNLIALITLSISTNSISGPIPKQLYNLPNLKNVNVSYNQLSGSYDDIKASWTTLCDYSGLHGTKCSQTCLVCSLGQIELKQCSDVTGQPTCLPSYFLLIGFVPLFLLTFMTLKRLVGDRVGVRDLITNTLVALISIVDILTNILFAIGTDGLVRTLCLVFLVVCLIVHVFIVLREFTLLTIVDQKFHVRVGKDHFFFSFFLILCTFSPRTLPFLANHQNIKSQKSLEHRIALLGIFVQGVPQLILQIVAQVTSQFWSTVVLIALFFTCFSILHSILKFVYFKSVAEKISTISNSFVKKVQE